MVWVEKPLVRLTTKIETQIYKITVERGGIATNITELQGIIINDWTMVCL